jgi:hypothetical protein
MVLNLQEQTEKGRIKNRMGSNKAVKNPSATSQLIFTLSSTGNSN